MLFDPCVPIVINAHIQFFPELDRRLSLVFDDRTDIQLSDAHDPVRNGMNFILIHVELLFIYFADHDLPVGTH